MFADVMVRVTGFAFVHFHAQSGFSSGGLKAFLVVSAPASPARQTAVHTVYHRIAVRVPSGGFLFTQDTLAAPSPGLLSVPHQ